MTDLERLGRKIADALDATPVAHYGDDEWARFLADHELPSATEIVYIDAAGRVVALP